MTLWVSVFEENMIEVPTDILNSTVNVIKTFYNDSVLFQLAEPEEENTSLTHFTDTAVLGFAIADNETYDDLDPPIRISFQGMNGLNINNVVCIIIITKYCMKVVHVLIDSLSSNLCVLEFHCKW